MDHPAYPTICARDDSRDCLLPFSFATLIYTTRDTLLTGDFEIGDACAPPPPARGCRTAGLAPLWRCRACGVPVQRSRLVNQG